MLDPLEPISIVQINSNTDNNLEIISCLNMALQFHVKPYCYANVPSLSIVLIKIDTTPYPNIIKTHKILSMIWVYLPVNWQIIYLHTSITSSVHKYNVHSWCTCTCTFKNIDECKQNTLAVLSTVIAEFNVHQYEPIFKPSIL